MFQLRPNASAALTHPYLTAYHNAADEPIYGRPEELQRMLSIGKSFTLDQWKGESSRKLHLSLNRLLRGVRSRCILEVIWNEMIKLQLDRRTGAGDVSE